MKHRPIRTLKLLPMPLSLCRENDICIWALPSWIYVKMAGHWNNEKSEFIVWFLAVIIKFSESQLSSTSNEWKKVTTVVNINGLSPKNNMQKERSFPRNN